MGPQCLQQPELARDAVGRAMMSVAIGDGLTVGITIGADVRVAARVGIGADLTVRVGVIVAVGMIMGAMAVGGVHPADTVSFIISPFLSMAKQS